MTTTSKSYTSRSNARRAARTAGFENPEIVEVEGGFAFVVPEAPVAQVEEPVVEVGTDEAMQDNGAPEENDPEGEIEAPPVGETVVPEAVAPVANPESPAPEAAPAKPAKVVRHRSEMGGATKLVWDLCDQATAVNPNVTRKELMALCEATGIAYYTARTQIQLWKKAIRGEALDNSEE